MPTPSALAPKAHVVVIGAGIGGLTAAVALRRAGFSVEVHERASEVRPVGAGLTIQPNAVLALRRLGLGDAVERAGAALRAGSLMLHDGRPLSRLPADFQQALASEIGAGIVGIHRATLHRILLDAVGRESVRLGHACSGYEVTDGQIEARFDDGSRVAGDLLVGADGIHSAVRAQLLGDEPPRFAGYTSWRGISPERCAFPEDFGGEMWGRGQRFGGCCIDGDRFYWFAVANAAAGERAPNGDEKSYLSERFAEWDPRVLGLIHSTPADAIIRTDIADRPPSSRWGEGRVTLLGDAAHAMTPNLGQGACQAIEDAVVLGLELGRAESPLDGLRAYEQARRSRANAVVVAARRLGIVAQWRNPIACALRNTLVRAMPPSSVKRQLFDSWRWPYD